MDAQEQHRLLELAAKAAGLTVRDSTRWPNTIVKQVTLDDGSMNFVRWAPHLDDGDSRRMEVALRLSVIHSIDGAVMVMNHDISVSVMEPAGGDQNATTRLAVLRAAAAIGEKMEEEE